MITCTYFKSGICIATGTDCEGPSCDGYIEFNDGLDREETPAE